MPRGRHTPRRSVILVRGLALCLLLPSISVLGQDSSHALITKQTASGEFAGWKSHCELKDTATAAVWTLRNNILHCKGVPKGYLYTVKKYTNFTLRLQWRWPPGKEPGNGGVLVRMTGPHKIWPKSLEAQINGGQAGDFWGLDGYSFSGPKDRINTMNHDQFGKLTNVPRMKDAERPAGAWNQYEITVDRGTVTLTINGQVVNRATDCDVTPGRICLTAEGDPIEFRNIELIGKGT